MATPTTLVEFWTSEVARIKAAVTTTQNDLAAAVALEAGALQAYSQSAKDLQATMDKVDALRKQLGAIPMPADGTGLLDELRKALASKREKLSAQTGADQTLRANRLDRQAKADLQARLGAKLADAQARLYTETAANQALFQQAADAGAVFADAFLQLASPTTLDKRKAWQDALVASPLKDPPGTATAALGAGAVQSQATAKIEADFPANAMADKSFIGRARARRDLAAGVLAATAADVAALSQDNAAWDESTGRKAALTPGLRQIFDAATDALKDFLGTGHLASLDIAALQALADRPATPLTQAQHDELFNNARKADREAALALLSAYDGKQDALAKAQADLAKAQRKYGNALFKAQQAAPDKSEADLLAADAALKALHDDLQAADPASSAGKAETAKTELATAKTGFETPLASGELPLAVLERWFAAVPEVLWGQLDTLDTATAHLNAIKTLKPADLLQSLKDAEDTLVKNLDACRKEQDHADTLRDSLSRRQADLAAQSELAVRRQDSAAHFVLPV